MKRFLLVLLLGWSSGAPACATMMVQLHLSEGSGPAGTTAQIELGMTNLAAVKGIQFDVSYNPEVVTFHEVAATSRAAMMQCEGVIIAPGQARVVLYYSDHEQLAIGIGEIAQLTFALVGLADSETDLTPIDCVVSNQAGEALVTTTSEGRLTVTDPVSPPELSIYPIRNPIQPRTFQLFVTSDQALAGGPQVTAGSEQVSLVLVDSASRTYAGIVRTAADIDWIVLTAQGVNGSQQGSAILTFVF